ncbi:MAG: HD domain-containing protein [Chloroflexi bacterium]|nr:HD domain-containing protein [Chloroflexota bacterium]
MVTVTRIEAVRPALADEFNPGEFIPRTEAIADAYRWGKELHGDQKRMSGEPYFDTHCVWVAGFIDNLVQNEAWTIAALLHDAVEDTGESLDQIRARFPGMLGEQVAYIVDGVTKLSRPRDGRSREIETLRKIAMFRDPGVFLVKLADKSHNLLTLEHMPESKRIEKATEAIRAYGKLAGILNCYRWRRWIEDMAFPHAYCDAYKFVREAIDSDLRLDLEFINTMIDQLAKIMERSGVEGNVQLSVNGYWQAWQKLRRMARGRKTSMNSFADLNDLVSFRMVVSSNNVEDCYLLMAQVNRFFGPYLDHSRFDDYIACPQNGYQALQITAYLPDLGAIEFAIATEEMEGENTWGVVYALRNGKDISRYRPVEILTPTGGARFVEEGSSVLDAVASIQQEFLLDKISAVEVNNNLAMLSDKVKPGDVVEVITSGPRLKPSPEWLNFANLSTARLLRIILATEALRKSAEHGREILKPVLADHGIFDLADVQSLAPEKVDNLLALLGCASLEDLYTSVGSGAIRMEDVDNKLCQTDINRDSLGWTTINLLADKRCHKPGVLAKLAGLVSKVGGNILLSYNITTPDGGFMLRLVIQNLTPDSKTELYQSYQDSGYVFKSLEIV